MESTGSGAVGLNPDVNRYWPRDESNRATRPQRNCTQRFDVLLGTEREIEAARERR
jgi:hypothetical protein